MNVFRWACAAVTLTLLGCGGGGGGYDGGTTSPPPPPPQSNQTLGSISTNVTSMNLTAGNTQTITVSAYDTQGALINNPGAPTFTSGSVTVAEVDGGGVVLGLAQGQTTINVSVTMGSVTRTAAVAVSVTGVLPSVASVSTTSGDFFTPNKVIIGRGGSVTWTFGLTTHNVTFGGTPGAPGNINSSYSTSETRTFATAGNFSYNCTLHAGMSGQVVVR